MRVSHARFPLLSLEVQTPTKVDVPRLYADELPLYGVQLSCCVESELYRTLRGFLAFLAEASVPKFAKFLQGALSRGGSSVSLKARCPWLIL